MIRTISPMKRFWLMLKPDKQDVTKVYIFAIFQGLINLSIPLGIQAIVNLIQGGQVSTSWIVLVFVVVAGVAVTGLLQLLQMRIIENLQQRLFVRAAFEFTYRIPKIKSMVLDRFDASELMNRFFDTFSIQKGLSKILIDFSTASLQIIFGLLLLSFYHSFFILFSVILVLLVIAIFRITAKKGLDTSLQESKYKYQTAYWLESVASSKESFKLAGKTDLHLRRTNNYVDSYLNAREGHFKILKQQYKLLVFFKSVVAAGLLLIGGLLVLNQQMNIGQFIAAEIIILLVINSVEKLILSIENIYDVLTALEKIGHVTDLETEPVGGTSFDLNRTDSSGISVEVNDITFSYPDAQKPVIDGVSLNIKAGEKVVITGSNGSGKSTLLHCIAGLYQAQSGSICLNGLPIGNFDSENLREHLGIRLSDEKVFNGTIYENISLGRANVKFEDVMYAIENAQLTNVIKRLPKGLDTVLGPEGAKLSKSTLQKLLLARSFVNKPGLLLLENSIAFIEEEERRKIIEFICSDNQPWTLIASSMDDYLHEKCMRKIQIRNTSKNEI